MKPLVERLQKEYEGTIEFRLLNVEKDQAAVDLANRMGVTAVPTFVFVNSDGVPAGTVIGSMTEDALRANLGGLK